MGIIYNVLCKYIIPYTYIEGKIRIVLHYIHVYSTSPTYQKQKEGDPKRSCIHTEPDLAHDPIQSQGYGGGVTVTLGVCGE